MYKYIVLICYKSIVLREDKYIMIIIFVKYVLSISYKKWVGRLEVKWGV
jgi:hypothetical protein